MGQTIEPKSLESNKLLKTGTLNYLHFKSLESKYIITMYGIKKTVKSMTLESRESQLLFAQKLAESMYSGLR